MNQELASLIITAVESSYNILLYIVLCHFVFTFKESSFITTGLHCMLIPLYIL
jgi:phosphotransferase system  glucose/maltose/N-acetylglucosamine-specific IIC component